VVQPVSPEQLRMVWEALVSGKPAPQQLGAPDGTKQPPGSPDNGLAVSARMEKQVKQRLTVAADHFNRDYRKGFQYCQVSCVPEPHPGQQRSLKIPHNLMHVADGVWHFYRCNMPSSPWCEFTIHCHGGGRKSLGAC
jgi:hypothetical protein